MTSGDVEGLARTLAQDAVLHGDGGGKRTAALHPIVGRDKILRFLTGIARKKRLLKPKAVVPARINGLPGLFVQDQSGGVDSTWALEIADNLIVAIYVVRNPDKLRHIVLSRSERADSCGPDRV